MNRLVYMYYITQSLIMAHVMPELLPVTVGGVLINSTEITSFFRKFWTHNK